MYNSILTNTTANFVLNNLNKSNSLILNTTTRLASGFKINSAKDDTAGSVISAKQKVQLSGMDAIKDSTMHAISLLNVAEGALDNMAESIIRIRDLSLYAMNSICSSEELNAIQSEIDELTNEIYRQKQTTMYNGMKLFNMEEIKEVAPSSKPYAYEVEYIQAGGTQYIDTGYSINKNDNWTYKMTGDFRGNTTSAWSGADGGMQLLFSNDNVQIRSGMTAATLTGDDVIEVQYKNLTETFSLNGTQIDSKTWSLSSSNYKIGLLKLGYSENKLSNGTCVKGKLKAYQLYKDDVLVRDFIPVVDKQGIACLYDKVSDSLFYNQGTGEFVAGEAIKNDNVIIEKKEFSLQVGANAGSDNAINVKLGLDFEGFGGNIFDAKETLNNCDRILEFINSKKAQIGSSMNRIESIAKLQENNYVNLANSISLTTDADFAFEGTKLANYQILRDISSTLFAQANSMNGSLALKLLGM